MKENTKDETLQDARLKELEDRIQHLEESLGASMSGQIDTRSRVEHKVDTVIAVLKTFGANAESWLRGV